MPESGLPVKLVGTDGELLYGSSVPAANAEGLLVRQVPQPGGSSLTDSELRAAPIEADLLAAVQVLLGLIANPVSVDPASGRMRVVLDATGGAQTLGTVTTVSTVTTVTTVTGVTTVSTVTNLSQIGAIAANSLIADSMNNSYANQVLRGIS